MPAWFRSGWNAARQSDMVEAFLIALATLAIVLYGQTRLEAREIRRNRRQAKSHPLVIHPSQR